MCAAVVALTTEGGLFGTMLGSFMTSTGNYVAQMLLPFTFGGMFAAMMTATGSSEKIGRYLISHFGIRFAPYAKMCIRDRPTTMEVPITIGIIKEIVSPSILNLLLV